MDVIVLDGEQRSSLAVTRSLGSRGIRVIVGADKLPSLSSCSRYCAQSFLYPSPYRDPGGFIKALKEFTNKNSNSMVIPMTDITMTEVLLNKGELHETVVTPFISFDQYIQVTDKINLYKHAIDLNVPIPTTFISTDYDDQEVLVETVRKSGFPVVVKPCLSKIKTRTGWVDVRVCYAKDERKLRKVISQDIFQQFPFLVQKRIEGPGIGVFLLMKDGEVIARFAHRRIREKPPSGGVSVLCEGIEMPAETTKVAIAILKKFHWTGVAMVEFKFDREKNIVNLLEVNARFWGSLQLAISSGVDFPYLLFQLANRETVNKLDGYTVGLRSRWELGDLDHLLARLLKGPTKANLPRNHPSRMKLLKDFLCDFFRGSVRNEVLRSNDAKPFFHELQDYVRYWLKSL